MNNFKLQILKPLRKVVMGFLTVGFLITCQTQATENRSFPPGAEEIFIANQSNIRQGALANIAPLVKKSIANGYYPGAVILVGHRGHIIYRGVFGNKEITPSVMPMQFDTVFDIASLTKVVVTTTAIMQLIENGQLDLDAPVASYWPDFAKNGKENVTVRELMTHTSGFQAILPAWKVPQDPSQHYASGLQQVAQMGLINPPGKVFTYSDINFITLGYLVELISGEKLPQYASEHIFQPLKMTSAIFLPPQSERDKIAPTYSPEFQQPRWGQVNDPTTERMGGATGLAGLFMNAHDLGIFLQCIIDSGRITENRYLLGPLTVLKMTTPQTPLGMLEIRGLGWDLDSSFSNRGVLLPVGSFGHTGWTGTSVWADPITQTWIIILTSRTHPQLPAKNQLISDRRAIANIVAGSLIDVNIRSLNTTGSGELNNYYNKKASPTQ
jgi:serine-type D-Ala-D-Ala carboxypeptidase